MSSSAISISNLHLGYKKNETILNGLNLEVPQGSIYGFLGRNGSGKSTTIRCTLGLLKQQDGEVSILERGPVSHDRSLFQDIGSLIEVPSLYNHLSAEKNLKIACELRGCQYSSIEKVLMDVGLYTERTKKVGKYSMGMKQRLGLAMALIHDPELLILDEPTNGLDPQGIQEMRGLLKNLQRQGKTIMLSSHLLSEIEKTATHIGVLNNGSLVFEGTIEKFHELQIKDYSVVLKVSEVDTVRTILNQNTTEILDKNRLRIRGGGERFVPDLIRKLIDHNIDIYEVIEEKPDLEQLFMHITK